MYQVSNLSAATLVYQEDEQKKNYELKTVEAVSIYVCELLGTEISNSADYMKETLTCWAHDSNLT